MAEKLVTVDDLPENMAGMSKNQLYDIMSQMKTLIEQNQTQAREILVNNPPLTRALFQAQMMLGMVQSPEAVPSIPQTTLQQPQQLAKPSQLSNVLATSTVAVQAGIQDQTSSPQAPNPVKKEQQNNTLMPVSSPSIPSSIVQSHPLPLHPLQSGQQPMEYHSAQATAMLYQQPSQLHNMPPPLHPSSQKSSIQIPMPTASTQSRQPSHTSAIPHMQLQPPLQPQPKPPLPAFTHQLHSQKGPSEGFQHSGAPQMHTSQPMFHSGHKHPVSVGPSFSLGQPALQPQGRPPYQGASPHLGMEFNPVASSMQVERGSWIPGLQDITTGTQYQQGASPFSGQSGPGYQPPQPQLLPLDMETALLQQVMSLTPEQVNILPPDQRNQVLQLQRMLRQ